MKGENVAAQAIMLLKSLCRKCRYLLFVPILFLCTACSSGTTDTEWIRMLAEADSVLYHGMEVRKAVLTYTQVNEEARNQLLKLHASIGLMKTAYMQSRNKDLNIYRDEAERLSSNIRSASELMTNDQVDEYDALVREFDTLVSASDFESVMHLIVGQDSKYVHSMHLVYKAALLTDRNELDAAIDTLRIALELYNTYHLEVNPAVRDTLSVISTDTLEQQSDSLSTEMCWIASEHMVAVPEWIAAIRQQLSITYGAMGMKAESDYNHNLYFDILDATRHDLRTEVLMDAEQQQRMHLYSVAALIALLMICAMCSAIFIVRRRGTKRKREYAEMLQQQQARLDGLYDEWMRKRNDVYTHLDDKLEETEDACRMHQMRIEEGKRSYLNKAAAVSIAQGIMPFLDRALNVIDRSVCAGDDARHVDMKLFDNTHAEKEYLYELLQKISEYNTALGHWVKIRQGTVTLHVESFALDNLFAMLAKAHAVFDADAISLSIPTDTGVVVKADKALTFFMLNTLMDNARKFTPRGGRVCVDVTATDTYAELSVSDTGVGMDADEVKRVLSGYSQAVGTEKAEVANRKGSGFGLMNCIGIIEKYRKTSRMFDVCLFDAESQVGKGSRFYFRLPLGKVLHTVALLFAIVTIAACTSHRSDERLTIIDNSPVAFNNPLYYELMDSIYIANTSAEYRKAVGFAAQILQMVNSECGVEGMGTSHQLMLRGDSSYAEIEMWKSGVRLDYNLILALRNEVIISALSLNDRPLYEYNNRALRQLYQCVSVDQQLNRTYDELRSQNNNIIVALNLFGFLTLLAILIFMLIYYRQYILPLFNLRQIGDVHDVLLDIDDDDLLKAVHDAIDEVRLADSICIATYDADGKALEYQHHGDSDYAATLEYYAQLSYLQHQGLSDDANGIYTFTLATGGEEGSMRSTIGALAVRLHGGVLNDVGRTMIGWIADFISVRIFCSQTQVQEKQLQLELVQDEALKGELEQNRLHVRNMILDNCLSAIKHETMYYPDRLRQLVDSGADARDISEMAHYYKDVLSLLLACATKQMEQTPFRRKTIAITHFAHYFSQKAKRLNMSCPQLKCHVGPSPKGVSVVCDVDLMEYLIDNLLTLAFATREPGDLSLDFGTSDGFAILSFCDSRQHLTSEEMSQLFFADTLRYDAPSATLHGAQYLLARQIIREHDDHCGRRGCRIIPRNGNTLDFYIPQCRENKKREIP